MLFLLVTNHFHSHFSEIIKLAKGENESQLNRMTQIEQDTFEMQVRAANIGKIYYYNNLNTEY